jgi:hypothetical protein
LPDTSLHTVRIDVSDAAGNNSKLEFTVRYNPALAKSYAVTTEQLVPQQVNVFEQAGFELFTSEYAVYDTVNIAFSQGAGSASGVSPLYNFASAQVPVHDSVRVRIKVPDTLSATDISRLIIKGVAGSRTVVMPAHVHDGWASTKFRQLGSFQLIADRMPPTINAPGPGAVIDARKLKRILFTPKDNMDKIAYFSAEVDGQWLRFTNDKGRTWIYAFDEMFPLGEHTLKVTVKDVAGNETTKEWRVLR